MSIVCSVIGHKASSATVWNRGHHFSTCSRCGADLVESEDDRWITPPAGYRIVRKQPPLAPATFARPASEPGEWAEQAEPARPAEPTEIAEPAAPAEPPEPTEAAEPKSVWEAVRDPEPISPLQEKRARPDRRVEQNGPLPASLAGVDRRRGDRRKSNGNFQPRRRKGLLAE